MNQRHGLTSDWKSFWPDPALHERIGGDDVIRQIIDGLYDRIASDPLLNLIFPKHLNRDEPWKFFVEWFGGERLYSDDAWKWEGMQSLHFPFAVPPKAAGLWLSFFKLSMQDAGVGKPIIREVMSALSPIALAMVNENDKTFETSQLKRSCAGNMSLEGRELERLLDLSHKGKLDEVVRAVDQYPNLIHKRGGGGRTLLWEAARGGRCEILTFLVELSADVHTPGSLPYRANFPFSPPRFPETLVALTPLTVASWMNRKSAVKFLRENEAEHDVFSCAYLGDISGLESICSSDRDSIHQFDLSEDIRRITPLHHAVAGEQLEASRWLIDHGAEVLEYGARLLTFAVRRNHPELVKLLLENGVSANDTYLMGVVTEDDTEVADMLVANGLNLDTATLWSPLIVRASRGDAGRDPVPHIRWVIANGADVNAVNGDGSTALHFASRGFDANLVQLLLENGADPNKKDAEGRPPLSLMHSSRATSDCGPVMELLLKHGADIEATDQQGNTPLVYAIRNKKVNAVAWLLAQGANRSHPNRKGATPVSVAQRGRRKESLEILKLLGASA